jgi:Ca2+:H+ antiporter
MDGLSRAERVILGLVVLLVVVAGVAAHASGFSHILAFVLAALALAGMAWVVSLCTEQVGMRYGAGVTGTLQSTVGNLPEFFVVLFALQASDTTVAETAILGSILVNALLVLGVVVITGSARSPDGVMRFRTRLPQDATTLLLVASFIIVLLGLVNHSGDAAAAHTNTISIVGAVVLLLVYGVWLRQYLTSAEEGPGSDDTRHQTPRLGMPLALALLTLAGGGSAFVSDWFVKALEPTIHTLHISQAFAGLVIVAIAGNAVENVAGIVLAYKGEANLAISVVKNSVAQIAAFLYPALVLVSLLTASRLTFSLAPVYIGALIGTAILVWQITGDGEATPFEGAALVATFLVIATVALYEH